MQRQRNQGQTAEHRLEARPVAAIGMLLTILMLYNGTLSADDTNEEDPWSVKQWSLQTSLYTRHWSPEPDHNNDQRLVALEAQFHNRWLAGVNAFRNSYDQSSQMIYIGKRWNLFNSDEVYFKLMGGLVHGYKGQYKDKTPMNGLGIAPVVLPAFGYRYRRLGVVARFAGVAAVVISGGVTF